jgi:hypothetical protein
VSVAKRWPVRGRKRIAGAVASNGDFGIARREALHADAEGPIPAVWSRRGYDQQPVGVARTIGHRTFVTAGWDVVLRS